VLLRAITVLAANDCENGQAADADASAKPSQEA
jgi:hypothetical protein